MFRASSGKAAAAGRLLIGAVALALLIPATAGCEAGFDAPTLQFHPASTGAHTVFNGIRISNVFVLGAPSGSSVPAGATAGLFLSLYNGGTSTDTLVGVSAPGSASSVAVSKGTVPLPLLSAVNLTGPQPQVVLSSLVKPLTGGQVIPVTLTFARAGSVTLQVPVEPQSYSFATFSPAPAPVPSSARPTSTVPSGAPATPSIGSSSTPTPGATPTGSSTR